jgi:transcription elongation factor GreA
MTSEGHRNLQQELARLKGEERIKAVRAIEEARAHGDLSENAEYDAAKNAQGLLEGRIRDLEAKLSTAQVVEIGSLSGSRVIFGATVRLKDVEVGEEKIITIVGEEESDVEAGFVSFSSPLARTLIGKLEGDYVEVKLPQGSRDYEILEVSFSRTVALKYQD